MTAILSTNANITLHEKAIITYFAFPLFVVKCIIVKEINIKFQNLLKNRILSSENICRDNHPNVLEVNILGNHKGLKYRFKNLGLFS